MLTLLPSFYMATAGLFSIILSQAAGKPASERDNFVRQETSGQFITYQNLYNYVIKTQRSSELREDITISEDRIEHDRRKAEQEKASQGDDGAGLFNLADEPTPYYGFTENEWTGFSETYRRGVREWAHDQAGRFITTNEANAWTDYISNANAIGVDATFGKSYKYKAFFQNVQDLGNAKNFQAAESEINAVTGARGYIQPGHTASLPELQGKLRRDSNSYSGCDIVPSITIGGKTFVIGNLSAISYSVHRDKVPVRLLGRTYAKSYVSGGATIAGSLIFTVFDTHVLDAIRREVVSEIQAAGGQSSPLSQQLPPFDVSIFFQNEYGHASYMRIYGVEITDEAQTHSINDIYTENQMQYVARDIDLMCKANDEWTPVNAAFSNNTLFSQYNLATPAFRLQNIEDNNKQIGANKIRLAKIDNEIRTLNDKIKSLQASDQTAENLNLISAYTAQVSQLAIARAPIGKEIESLQNENENLSSYESITQSGAVNLGSNTSDGRDDPYAITRVRSSKYVVPNPPELSEDIAGD